VISQADEGREEEGRRGCAVGECRWGPGGYRSRAPQEGINNYLTALDVRHTGIKRHIRIGTETNTYWPDTNCCPCSGHLHNHTFYSANMSCCPNSGCYPPHRHRLLGSLITQYKLTL
ncbi:hypothetical protein BaRGS_00037818, partial [Batillaria attramentaria]